jgi:hypothetical protein
VKHSNGRRLRAFVSAAAFAAALSPALAVELAWLAAEHAVVTAEDDGRGLYLLTLELVLSNPGDADLFDLELSLLPGRTLIVEQPAALSLAGVAAGTSIIAEWVVETPEPPELFAAQGPLLLSGEAVDASGASRFVEVISEPMPEE